MKLLVIGIGDCGCNLAGAFAELNRKAKAERRVQIIVGAYAVNNNQSSLDSLSKAKRKELQTIFINRSLEDIGKFAEAGAELMRLEGGRVLTAVKPGDFCDTDAILLIAGSAGNLGSGGVPVIAQQIRERHVGKPIYALIALPFKSESSKPQCIYNTAICLKSTQKITEAVFLVDNEKFRLKAKSSSTTDMTSINQDIAFPFYDLLCASEGVDSKYIGARTLGIGDLMQTLTGWTSIGAGTAQFATSRSFLKPMQNFQEKGAETQKTMEAMSSALGQLSIDSKMEDAGKALYLLSVPAKGANVEMVKDLGNRLRELTNDAEIRGGDFYGAKDCAQVTLLLSGLTYIETVKSYYDKAVDSAKALKTEKQAK